VAIEKWKELLAGGGEGFYVWKVKEVTLQKTI
jgi:heme exporter protein D